MRHRLANLFLAAPLLGGCSLLNKDPTPPDAEPDGPRDVAACALKIDSIFPSSIPEGQGTDGGRPAVVVVEGSDIKLDAAINVISRSGNAKMSVIEKQVSSDFRFIALQIVSEVDESLNEGAEESLDITVTQTGDGCTDVTATTELKIRGLPELTTFNGNVADLRPLYSKVMLAQPVVFSGTAPAIIRATSSIQMDALSAVGVIGGQGSGNSAVATAGGNGGPGGCSGGSAGNEGNCPNSNGKGSRENGGGGGGAGFASDGATGGGTGAGGGGGQTGDSLLINLSNSGTSPNRASGGGGGRAALLGNAGAGGGGGGIIELTAGGNIIVGAIDVHGGKGGDANALVGGAGAGGGGAGGAVLLRAGNMLTAKTVDVSGGVGGVGTTLLGVRGDGGVASAGRIRYDALVAEMPPAGLPAGRAIPRQGPSFARATPMVVQTATSPIDVIGSPDMVFDTFTTDRTLDPESGEQGVSSGIDGTAHFDAALKPGYNRLCLLLEGGTMGRPEAQACVEIAYLP